MPDLPLSILMILISAFFACFAYSRMGLIWKPQIPIIPCTIFVALLYGAINYAVVYLLEGKYMLLILQPLNILLVKLIFNTGAIITLFCANVYVYIYAISKIVVSSTADIIYGTHVHVFGNTAKTSDICIVLIFTYLLASILMYLFTMCVSKSTIQDRYKNQSSARMATIKRFTVLLLVFYVIETLGELFAMSDRAMAVYHLALSLLIGVSFFIMFVYFSAVDSVVEGREQINKEYHERRFAYYNGQAKYLDEFRRFRHDYKNRMTGLKMLLDSGEVERAKEYLTDVSEKFDVMREHTKNYSDNTLIDSILQNFSVRCQSAGIDYQAAVIVGNEIPLSDMDICTIFYNIADNAFEAATKEYAGDKYIRFETSRREKWLIVTAENSFDGIIIKGKEGIETSKEDSLSHGIGLKNIKTIVESIPGAMVKIEPDTEERIFRISLIFPREQEK